MTINGVLCHDTRAYAGLLCKLATTPKNVRLIHCLMLWLRRQHLNPIMFARMTLIWHVRSLRVCEIRQFAGPLLTAIDQDTDPEFTLVSNNKRSSHPSLWNQQPATSMPQRSASTGRQRPSLTLASGAQAPHPSPQGRQVEPRRQPDEHGAQSQSSGQHIPVVQLGATNAARKTTPPTYSHVLYHGQRTNASNRPNAYQPITRHSNHRYLPNTRAWQ